MWTRVWDSERLQILLKTLLTLCGCPGIPSGPGALFTFILHMANLTSGMYSGGT